MKVPGVFGARVMSCMFDLLLITLFQLQASWHIMQLTGILAAETAYLLMQHKVSYYSPKKKKKKRKKKKKYIYIYIYIHSKRK